MKNKILLLGKTGQLGWELHRAMFTLGELVALDYPQVDMADPDSIHSVVEQYTPNLIVNATAYTAVNKAESEPELAMAINGIGPGILAEEALRLEAGLIHYSTDYVFDGNKGEPYSEGDQPNPINVYGQTKLAGEHAVQEIGGAYLIFRTSWVYTLRQPCFVTKVLQWAREHETIRIVDDQISSPTWARNLAEATAQIIAQGWKEPVAYFQEKNGLYHLTGGGSCSRFDGAKSILEMDPHKEEQVVTELIPVASEMFPTPALRPHNSTLSNQKFSETFNLISGSYQKALSLMLTG